MSVPDPVAVRLAIEDGRRYELWRSHEEFEQFRDRPLLRARVHGPRQAVVATRRLTDVLN